MPTKQEAIHLPAQQEVAFIVEGGVEHLPADPPLGHHLVFNRREIQADLLIVLLEQADQLSEARAQVDARARISTYQDLSIRRLLPRKRWFLLPNTYSKIFLSKKT